MERTESTEDERTAPLPEVLEKPVRRRFAAEYKARILAEADACTEMGQLGELLRREGLYSSHLSTWRRQRDEGGLAGLTPKRRGRKAKAKNPLADENERLRRENRRKQVPLGNPHPVFQPEGLHSEGDDPRRIRQGYVERKMWLLLSSTQEEGRTKGFQEGFQTKAKRTVKR